MNLAPDQRIAVTVELTHAYHGAARHGHTAEIYAYALDRARPVLEAGGPGKARERAERAQPAGDNLLALLRAFQLRTEAQIHVNGLTLNEYAAAPEFDHRVHVQVHPAS